MNKNTDLISDTVHYYTPLVLQNFSTTNESLKMQIINKNKQNTTAW